MSDASYKASTILVTTSLVTFVSGFLLGIYSIKGYLISPALAEERRKNYTDPLESDESEVDEGDSILDHAPNWANGPEADKRDGLKQAEPAKIEGDTKKENKDHKADGQGSTKIVDNGEECKLVLVVRTDLGMTKGKIAAQCSHATLAVYKSMSRTSASPAEQSILKRWERQGQAKIAVQVKSQDDLTALLHEARRLGITAEAIHDAGRTQIEAGSMTVVGVGPAPKSLVDQVTGKLKLL